MEGQPILLLSMLNQRISELLTDIPGFFLILLKHHTACSGCYLASFCSLRDAVDAHGLDPADLLNDVRAVYAPPDWPSRLN